MEDLEGELEKKMELLEKERKALRKETQGHHKEIDEGLNTLHNRIAELEQSERGGTAVARGWQGSGETEIERKKGFMKDS